MGCKRAQNRNFYPLARFKSANTFSELGCVEKGCRMKATWSEKLLLIMLIVIAPLLSSASAEIFPKPPQLEDNVQFWIKIFAFYSEKQALIHDAEKLGVIYTVVDLEDGSMKSSSSPWRKVEAAKDEYIKILKKLDILGRDVSPDQLSESERHVYQLWAFSSDPQKYDKAIRNIRGQSGLRERFKAGLERSGRYMEEIKRTLHKYNLPEELGFLPHVESSFHYKAYSKLGAAGLWQFMRRTGRLYMIINYSIDERLDPITATDAAARLLKHNYEELRSWPLAITAYNHGLGGMKRAKAVMQTDDIGIIAEKYSSRTFGFASRNFYAEFLAVTEIAKNYEQYFGPVQFHEPIRFKTFALPDYVSLDLLAKTFNIEKTTLIEYNPALRPPTLTSHRRIPKGYRLRLPDIEDLHPEILYANIIQTEKYDNQVSDGYYRVQPGDNLGAIARTHGTSIETLMALNNIHNPNRIREGQLLELPGSAAPVPVPESKPVLLAENTPRKVITEAQPSSKAPQMGHEMISASVAEILTKTSVEIQDPYAELMIVSKETYGPLPSADYFSDITMDKSSPAMPEMVFEVSFDTPQSDIIIVQPEETWGHFSEWTNVSAYKLRSLNHLPQSYEIHVGQRIRLDFNRVTPEEFHNKRLEFHRGIQEDFFSSFTIADTKKYKIRAGDNIWQLCTRTFEVPYWLLQRYNKGRDLLKLFPGDEIVVPSVIASSKNGIIPIAQ